MRLPGLSLALIVLVAAPAAAQARSRCRTPRPSRPRRATSWCRATRFSMAASPSLGPRSPRGWSRCCRAQSATSPSSGQSRDPVDLLDVQRDVEKKRYLFHVRAPQCDGWVPKTALSTKKVTPIGTGSRK